MKGNRLQTLLTATMRYEKSLSTRHRGAGVVIQAPVLAYLVETPNGRILYDVGCDYAKVADPALRARWFDPAVFEHGPPEMTEDQRLASHLARLGLEPADIDVVFIGHLHFDHAGGICDVPGCEIHVQADEMAAGLHMPLRRGVYVSGGVPASPAAKAGLATGDVILELDGRRVDERTLPLRASVAGVGRTVKLTVWRGGAEAEVPVTMERLPR